MTRRAFAGIVFWSVVYMLATKLLASGVRGRMNQAPPPPFYPSSFAIISNVTLWSGTGSTDWLGRPQLLDDGTKWIVIYRQASQHTQDTQSRFHIRFSLDEGVTWTAEDTFTDSGACVGAPFLPHDGYNVSDAILLKAPNGNLLVLTAESWPLSSPSVYGTFQFRSTDGGKNWSDEGKINSDNELQMGGGQAVVVGSDIYVASYVDVGANREIPYGTKLYKSTDSGVTWTLVSTIDLNTNEAGIAYFSPATLLTLERDDNEIYLWRRISTDFGGTWDTLTNITSLTGNIQRPMLFQFADEPVRVYLAGRDYYGGGANQNCSLQYTDDGGLTWSTIFHPDGVTAYEDAGYSTLLKRSDGTYYLLSYRGTNATASIAEFVIEGS